MAVCTFFGHHDCPASVKEELRETIRDLIENCGVSMFYVGNHGTFDAIVWKCQEMCSRETPKN